MSDKSNLNIVGVGNTSGGNYEKVLIMGVAVIEGSVTIRKHKCLGVATVKGNITVADKYSLFGTQTVDGNMKAKSVKVRGTDRVKGTLDCEEIHIAGTGIYSKIRGIKKIDTKGVIKIQESLECNQLEVRGVLEAKEEIAAEKVMLNGSFHVDGLLTGDVIDITLKDKSYAREIGGQTIKVESKGTLVNKGHLNTESIEGDNIQLESTEAKLVRGKNVIIGSGCVIERVEYKSSVNISSKAKVNEVVQV
ncbi:hypothetical protein [Vallitalea okinawensis]|uniref:hypothetical protein n=1 Tax=Vallitalea okinawensis TaxID=2078660 RepID=UPI000CFB5B7D|nr:hypothetical protein [Vallitalea okinawensis]